MPRQETINLHNQLTEAGITAEQILQHILYDIMSGAQSESALQDCLIEFGVIPNYQEDE